MRIRALPLVAVLLLPIAVHAQKGDEGQLIQLLEQIKVLQQSKQESRAVPIVERALSIADRTFPPNDARYVSVLLTAGEVFWKAGDKRRAELHLRRSAEIAEKNLDQSHPLVFASLANLALFYREIEDGVRS